MAYPGIMGYFGFILATGLSLLAIFRIIQYRTWMGSILISAVITLISYLVFTVLLGVHFPGGIWG
jgi:hypothetical protein